MHKYVRFALVGALVGAVVGAAIGVGAARASKQLPAGSEQGGFKLHLDANRAFQLGMSIFGLVRQFLELGR
jgi:gas vesicle protein